MSKRENLTNLKVRLFSSGIKEKIQTTNKSPHYAKYPSIFQSTLTFEAAYLRKQDFMK